MVLGPVLQHIVPMTKKGGWEFVHFDVLNPTTQDFGLNKMIRSRISPITAPMSAATLVTTCRHRVKHDPFYVNWQVLQHIVLLSPKSCIFEFSTSKCTNFHPLFFRHWNNMLETYAWLVVGGSCLLTQ